MEYNPSNPLRKIAQTPFGQELWIFLNKENIISNMALATRLHHPAVEGIEKELISKFSSDMISKDKKQEKQLIGHMVRQVMESKGYGLDQQNVSCNIADVFVKATRYKKI